MEEIKQMDDDGVDLKDLTVLRKDKDEYTIRTDGSKIYYTCEDYDQTSLKRLSREDIIVVDNPKDKLLKTKPKKKEEGDDETKGLIKLQGESE